MPHPTPLLSGTRLYSPDGAYEIISVLGSGGFGITYKVTGHVKVGNIKVTATFAIKEHFLGDYCSRDSTTSKVIYFDHNTDAVKTSLTDFIAEARRLQRIGTCHDNIVKVNEVFEANNTAYYVMEYIEGESLAQYVEKRGHLSPVETVAILSPVIDAVKMLHNQRITHLDIKPHNIMLLTDADGNLKPVLIDFGLAKHYDRHRHATSTLRGSGYSEGYSPIEQYRGITTFSPTADIYAIGATILFCLTGKTPPPAIECDREDIENAIPGNTPDILRNCILSAMAQRRNNRIQSIEELERLLLPQHQNLSHIGTSTRPATPSAIHPFNYITNFLKSLNFKWIGITAIILCLVLCATILLNPKPVDPDLSLSEAEQYRLGMFYLEKENFGSDVDTDTVAMDIDKVIKYLTLAAEKGNANAQFELGNIYSGVYQDEIGKPFTVDGQRAINYYEMAGNHPEYGSGYAEIARLYFIGNGKWNVTEIPLRITAMDNAGHNLTGISPERLSLDMGVVRDGELAIKYFNKALEGKNENHGLDLPGLIYEFGINVPIDYRKAAEYYIVSENPENIDPLLEKMSLNDIAGFSTPVDYSLACTIDGEPVYLPNTIWAKIKNRWGTSINKIGVYVRNDNSTHFRWNKIPADGFVIALKSLSGLTSTAPQSKRCLQKRQLSRLSRDETFYKIFKSNLSFYGGVGLGGNYWLKDGNSTSISYIDSNGKCKPREKNEALTREVYPLDSWWRINSEHDKKSDNKTKSEPKYNERAL